MARNKKKFDKAFKVAGAKSLKLKAKAKAVKSELKQIVIKNKAKVDEIDKALQQLESTVRHTDSAKQVPQEIVKTKLPSSSKHSIETKQKSEEAMNELGKMQL